MSARGAGCHSLPCLMSCARSIASPGCDSRTPIRAATLRAACGASLEHNYSPRPFSMCRLGKCSRDGPGEMVVQSWDVAITLDNALFGVHDVAHGRRRLLFDR